MGNFFTSRVPVVTDTNYNLSLGVYNNIGAPNTDNIPIGPWAIEPGFVEFVNPDDYSCYVVSDSGRVIPRALCLSSWFSFSTGAGMYTYPQPNSRVLIGYSSKQEGFILGFIPCQNYDTENLYLNNRTPDLTDGDIHICTEYGSFIQMCNKGQIINVECDPVCKIEMQSTEHKIFMKSHRVYINTAAGLLQMDTTDDGRTTTVAYFRMKTGDVDNFVKVIIGNTGVSVGDKLQLNTDGSRSSTEVIFALNICNKASITVDTDGNVVTYCKSIQNRVVEDVDNIINGSVTSAIQKGVSTANNGDLKIMATGSLEVAANDKLILSGGQSLEAVSPKTTLASTGSLDITCSGVMTRSSNGAIIDKGTSIQHSAGGAGAIPEITNVTVTDVKAVGIMDTSVSEMEKYNPALASSIPDPTKESSASASGSPNPGSDSQDTTSNDDTPAAAINDPETDVPEEAPTKAEVRILAIAKKEYYKKSRTGNLCREGTMTLYNNDNTVAGSYYFMNGPWGKGAIPLGTYTVSGGQRTSQKAMSVKDPVSGKKSGWKFNVSDVYDSRVGATRSLLRIHPDGNTPGSEGCFVISGTYATLEDFYNKLTAILKANNGKVKLEYKKG